MAGEKKGEAPPIDRPLVSAYLRGFDGWSTAYPPELSEPSTVRVMENVLVTPESALRIRPGLRSAFAKDFWVTEDNYEIVGGYEHFMATSTRKGIILAVRNADTRIVEFRTFIENLEEARFDPIASLIPGLDSVTYPETVTFIKYLQIDNKILVLPNDPAVGSLIVNVGADKSVRRVPIGGLTRPLWTDVLQVLHPEAAWINGAQDTIPTAETPIPGETGTLIAPTELAVTVASGQPFTTLIPHNLRIGEKLVLRGTTAPTGFTLGTTYYVRQITSATQFTVSLTSGGTVVNPTSAGANLKFEQELVNTWTFGYYYTVETEFGESAPSDMVTVRAQRGWSQWRMYIPEADGTQGELMTSNPDKAMDQLVSIMPEDVYNASIAAEAVRWNLYMVTWSDTTAVPSTGLLVGTKTFEGDPNQDRWIQHTPAALADAYVTVIPTEDSRENYSGAPTATQGIVAGDRVILVNDERARITWSANIPGEYTNFTPVKGGGRKTLSAGNLQVPINVQLWQNPQAVDTLTVLCAGLDGYHSAYYMAPAAVSGQSDSTLIMGFEETTATPGTVSPYGVEVHRNALYHPLEEALMKSTAANYVISHKTMTDDISNMWRRLVNKKNIVSSYLGDYIYYLVHNPAGDELQPGCVGNEIWVMQPGKEGAVWSRWKVQGIALRKLELGDYLYMSVVTPSAIFLLDPLTYVDEFPLSDGTTGTRAIPWKFVTNSLGANSRRDSNVYVQQARLHMGDWIGEMEWGIRAWDGHGRPLNVSKVFQDVQDGVTLPLPDHQVNPLLDLGDTSDVLQIRTPMTEWALYAGSREVDGEVQYSYGQINMARFQFIQLSVNEGYQDGNIQSFEYARNVRNGNDGITQNGVPRPRQDPRRP